MSRVVFLDTETTGLSPEAGDRVIEIGCIEMVNRRLTDRSWHRYLNPDRSSSPEAVRVHGLTDEFLADKPRFADVVEGLLDFVKGAEVVIHNAAFDVGFLNAELRRAGKPAFHEHVGKISDSLLMARSMFPGKANSLDALCRRLEVDNSGRDLHGALLDAGLLAEVYIRMTRGQDALTIDAQEEVQGIAVDDSLDLSTLSLTILSPSQAELEAHEVVLRELDKSSNGKTLWRAPVA